MKKVTLGLALVVFVICVAGIGLRADDADKEKALRAKLIGTWKLVSAKYGGQAQDPPNSDVMLKHVTPAGFTWLSYKKDSGEVYRSAGGTYTLKGDSYTEKVVYGLGDDFQQIKNAEHPFTCKIDGDKWQHNGKLAGGLTIEEVWERVKAE